MSAIAFDPWAALEKSRAALPPAKTAIPAKPCPRPRPGLAALAGLAGGHVQSANCECLEAGQLPTPSRGSDGHLRHPRARGIPTPARAAVPTRARVGGDSPAEWRDGVERLAIMSSPARIESRRWAAYVVTADRLLHQHGPALHGAGWGTLELFGLHRRAPATYPPGWGLAWLLDVAGEVMDVTPDEVGMRRVPGGARLVYRHRTLVPGVVPAWGLAPG